MIIREVRRQVSFLFREIRNARYRMFGVDVGKNVFISSGAWIDTQDGKIIIEDGVRITNGVKILSHDYSLRVMGLAPAIKTTKIGKGSFIGMNAILLPGVTIGEGCIVGAGCVVSEDLDDFSVLVAAKTRVIKKKNIANGNWESVK